MYILGGYINNYVLSVRTKSQTHSQEWSGAEQWNGTTDINPPRFPDSNRSRLAVHGLLELQGEFGSFISVNRETTADMQAFLASPECLGEGPRRIEILEPGGLRTVYLQAAS